MIYGGKATKQDEIFQKSDQKEMKKQKVKNCFLINTLSINKAPLIIPSPKHPTWDEKPLTTMSYPSYPLSTGISRIIDDGQ